MPADFLTLMLDGRVPMKFRLIPPGEFRMGSRGFESREEPIHRVRITKPFYIGVYPVTQLQWRTIVETVSPPDAAAVRQGSVYDLNPDPSDFKGANRPVENVNWHDSQAWCQLLNHSNALRDCVDDAGGRVEIANVNLPTEAEWEYACRLVQTHPHPVCSDTEYSSGDGESALSAAGWYGGNSESQTHEVGGKAPNGIGLYDMHGNVWEWCRDAWMADTYKVRIDGASDPCVSAADVGVSETDAARVIRGGSWDYSAWDCRAAYRLRGRPGNRTGSLGFRVCLFFGSLVPSQQTGTVAESEPRSVDVARRQAAAKSEDRGGDVAEVDLSEANLPKRSDGKKF